MQARSFIAKLILIAFILAAVFGVYAVALAPMGEEVGCPFAMGQSAVCAALFEHLSHWQSAFAAILAELLVVATLFIFFVRSRVPVPKNSWPLRYRLRVFRHIPLPLQEAFSSGILNPKIF